MRKGQFTALANINRDERVMAVLRDLTGSSGEGMFGRVDLNHPKIPRCTLYGIECRKSKDVATFLNGFFPDDGPKPFNAEGGMLLIVDLDFFKHEVTLMREADSMRREVSALLDPPPRRPELVH